MQQVLEVSKVSVLPDGRMDAVNASRYMGLSQKTLAMLRSSGEGPEFVKMGRVFYFKKALDMWIADRTKRSTAEGA